MLTVTVEMLPLSFDPTRKVLATVHIFNLSSLADTSDYRIETVETKNTLTGEPARRGESKVANHPRPQPVLALIEKACATISKAEFKENCSDLRFPSLTPPLGFSSEASTRAALADITRRMKITTRILHARLAAMRFDRPI
jgi:hypothetical protein